MSPVVFEAVLLGRLLQISLSNANRPYFCSEVANSATAPVCFKVKKV